MDMNSLQQMLDGIRIADLQSLLSRFGQNRNGRKPELVQRLVGLITRPPPGVKGNDVYMRARDMYNSNLQRNIQSSHSYMSNQAVRPTGSMPTMSNSRGMYPQQPPAYQNNMYAGLQHPQQLLRPPPVLLPRVLPDIDECVTLAQIPDATGVSLREIPFHKILGYVIEPRTLVGRPIGRPHINARLEICSVVFRLPLELVNSITENQHWPAEGDHSYPVDLILRFCCYSGPGVYDDCLPLDLAVRVTGEGCQLPPVIPSSQKSAEGRRYQPRHMSIVRQTLLSPVVDNKLSISWTPEENKQYAFAVYVSKGVTTDELVAKLQHKVVPSDMTKEAIRKDINKAIEDEEVATTVLSVSLVCPVGSCRIACPVKGRQCNHLRFFNAASYISMNERRPVWLCPLCNKKLFYEELEVYEYFQNILKSGDLPEDCKEIELLADGSWKPCLTKNDENGEKLPTTVATTNVEVIDDPESGASQAQEMSQHKDEKEEEEEIVDLTD